MTSLNDIKFLFCVAANEKRSAERCLAENIKPGQEIVFRRGNMVDNHNAQVLCVSGRGVKIRNLFTDKVRWIDVMDIQGL